MKIIKQGDLNRLKKTVSFECKTCGCIFEADKDEYSIQHQYNHPYVSVTCPCCKDIVHEDL